MFLLKFQAAYTIDHEGSPPPTSHDGTEMQHMVEDGKAAPEAGADIENTTGATAGDKAVLARLTDEDLASLDQQQHELIKILRDLRNKYPEKSALELQEMAEVELMKKMPKNRGYYRMQATRRMVGSGAIIKREKVHDRINKEAVSCQHPCPYVVVYFRQ